MTNHNDSSRFDGITEQFNEEQDLALQATVLAEDFPKRLERLHEVSGLTWAAFARSLGFDDLDQRFTMEVRDDEP
ncbi:MAG: hypothetical protein OXC99_05065 [Chloroflexi bacterium]|nr:hypothetical protein [Chloroflexota bacterium]